MTNITAIYIILGLVYTAVLYFLVDAFKLDVKAPKNRVAVRTAILVVLWLPLLLYMIHGTLCFMKMEKMKRDLRKAVERSKKDGKEE